MDRRDRVSGASSLGKCLKEGLLHRAVAVLVYRPGNRILMQRRSKIDLWHPGLLTLSSTGHVGRGETYAAAARRELWEELGLKSTLHPKLKLLLRPIKSGGLTEWEWVKLFTTKTSDSPSIDSVELDSVEEVTEQEVRKMMRGKRLTPDAKLVLAAYFEKDRRSKPPSAF